ncbi:MAG: LysR family transcriptional regulator [Nevskiales bacterium]|nr:LysR family transcriptional regulator [Nevskiales bacterium]
MNWRSFEYVVALKQTGSLHAAAERCNATPGTVSAQITRLEGYLGVRLFEQRRAPAEPTVEGAPLLALIESAVLQIHRVRSAARDIRARRCRSTVFEQV